MDLTISRKNYDPTTNLNWHRKVNQHPDTETNSIAEAFCSYVAGELGISPPEMFWFEEADFGLAKATWDTCLRRKDQAEDPLGEECEYFRWRNPWNRRGPVLFNGYTPHGAPQGIMINVNLRGEDLLNAVAHECFHLHQDSSRPEGWRADPKNAHIVEVETEEWVHSMDGDIQNFLLRWAASTAPA